MFTLSELKHLQKVLNDTESQDEETLSVLSKTNDLINSAEDNKECLWSFYWDCGRAGNVEGMFKATKEEVYAAIGKEVYFGEILGKHNEVYGKLEEVDLDLISEDPIFVMNAFESGYNPLEHIEE